MLDNPQDPNSSQFLQDEVEIEPDFDNLDSDFKAGKNKSNNGKFLGLKSQQLFILLVMLFLVVCLLGVMLLLVTGKIEPTFL